MVRPVPGVDSSLGANDFALQRQQLPRRPFQAGPRLGRDALILLIGDHHEQLLDPRQPGPRHHTERRLVRPERVDQHGSLANQKLAGPVQHQNDLPLGALHRDKAHDRLRNAPKVRIHKPQTV